LHRERDSVKVRLNNMRRTAALCLFALASTACAENEDSFDLGNTEVRGAKHHKACPHTIGYWKTHNVYATNPSQNIPWPISEDSGGCGITWLEVLDEEPDGGDAWIIVARQYIAAALNWSVGAQMPADVYNALNWSGAYLQDCQITDEEREAAIAYAELLDAYNNGLAGVPACVD
jgi:hypothetical protein